MSGETKVGKISPPVARAVAVLNFLGGHSGQAFTLTELSKSLRISSATCHNLLGALVDEGYVYRTAAKTYILGPAVSRLARSSLDPNLLMHVVRPEMRLLADEFDAVCSASFRDGERIHVRERAAAVSHIAWNVQEGLDLPFAAPIGNLFVAWSASGLEEWLDAAQPPLTEEARAGVLRALEFLRVNGYTFGVRTAQLSSSEKALELKNQPDMTDYAIAELDPERAYDLAYVSCPVFAKPGHVTFALSLLGFVKPVKGAAVEKMAEKLLSASRRISDFIAGRDFTQAD